MPPLPTNLDVKSDAFQSNRDAMHKKLEAVRALEQAVRNNSEAKREKFDRRNQLLPRMRIEKLLDQDTPFVELSTLAGLNMHDDKGGDHATGAGSIIGIGIVSGKSCLVMANDSAIKGGTVSPMGLQKHLRAQRIALENKLPIVNLVESGGANLLYQSEMFVEGGRSFANQARLSAAGIPQITVVHGSSTAGGAYVPGLSDYTILIKDRAKIFLAGPPLVKAAIGEQATDEELGGAQLHATQTGLCEYLVDDDINAMAMARDVMDKLKWETATSTKGDDPLYEAEELLGIVPDNGKIPFDIREVIARIVDGSDFLAFKENYGAETICGHARINGHLVGIIGNNGPIQPHGSAKAGQFIQLCDQSQTPLVFLQNTTGYMVGKQAERDGAVKHGSKMIQAVANARVPKFTIIIGGSYGAGNYGMCGRGFDPRFIFSWPTARIAIMGGAQAAKVMEIITRQKAERLGQAPDEEQIAAANAMITHKLDSEADILFGTARLWDDGIIDPRQTRNILSLCLQLAQEAGTRQLHPNVFGVARF